MAELKITTETLLNGNRVVTHADGYQKSVYFFKAGNDTDDADAFCHTARDTRRVSVLFRDMPAKVRYADGIVETKAQIIASVRRAVFA